MFIQFSSKSYYIFTVAFAVFELEFSENYYPNHQNSPARAVTLFTIFPGTERVKTASHFPTQKVVYSKAYKYECMHHVYKQAWELEKVKKSETFTALDNSRHRRHVYTLCFEPKRKWSDCARAQQKPETVLGQIGHF